MVDMVDVDAVPRLEEIQWHHSSGVGVRSWALYGITKVHLRWDGAYRTLCGRRVARPSLRLFPSPTDPRCVLCERKALSG